MTVVTPTVTAARGHAQRRDLDLRIDELVLHGFRHADRYEIAAAIERELGRLFREGRAPASWLDRAAGAGGANTYRLDAGAFDVAHDASPQAVGVQVAQAIHRGLAGGHPAGGRHGSPSAQPPGGQGGGAR